MPVQRRLGCAATLGDGEQLKGEPRSNQANTGRGGAPNTNKNRSAIRPIAPVKRPPSQQRYLPGFWVLDALRTSESDSRME
jgi:hypothetical protein